MCMSAKNNLNFTVQKIAHSQTLDVYKRQELLCEYLGFGKDIWNWEHVFDTLTDLAKANGETEHRLKFLEPRFDFFPMKAR